jgi:hypothetical protein
MTTGFYQAISGSAARFRALLPRAAETQKRRLLALLRRNADTEFGRRHGFASIRDEEGYRARVPVASYDDLRPAIERMAAGEPEVLASGRVMAFEETGGSGGGAKLIPCTEETLAAFRRALLPWLDDLAAAHPAIARGRAYWAISPAARAPRRTSGGAPIGLASDAAYFGERLAPLLAETLASPPGLANLRDVDAWREATCRALLECRDLTLISVWSPSFLALLLDSLGERDLSALWPQLAVVSCWDQGSSRREAAALRARLPGVHVQGKGLLATEGVMTIPLRGLAQPVLAIDSAYFEFQDDAGRCHGACELEPGGEYQVLLSTEGGLYRYAIGDRVKVRGFAGTAPLLEFLGRGAQFSDLRGEKLSEPFVVSALQPLDVRFAMVAPADAQDRYLLYLDAAEASAERATTLAARAEAALCRNPQYAYARRLGQLAALEPRRCARPLDSWLSAGLARGQRLGDIKPPALAPAGWPR